MGSYLIPVKAFLNDLQPQRLKNLPDDHPLLTAGRTYALSLSLSLGPALISLLTSRQPRSEKYTRVGNVLRKEFGVTGFAFAITLAVGGGAALDYSWRWLDSDDRCPLEDKKLEGHLQRLKHLLRRLALSPYQKALVCNAITSLIAITLIQARKRSSRVQRAPVRLAATNDPLKYAVKSEASETIDLTLLLFVRAADAAIRKFLIVKASHQAKIQGKQADRDGQDHETTRLRDRVAVMTNKLDAFLFWAASARIMWCFFYLPERLPHSYLKWIGAMANLDERLIEALRKRREGVWTYGEATPYNAYLRDMAEGLGYPPTWGDTLVLPPRGGPDADKIWAQLGVHNRSGLGGLPCEIVHGGVASTYLGHRFGGSCTMNALSRGVMGFMEALLLYTPVHFLPVLLTGPGKLLSLPFLQQTILSVLRSSLFLSTFLASVWSFVCFTRTLVIARLFPSISHNFYDGPFGCILAGCLACGGSIWIEKGRRRGEMALYVLPKALRSLLSNTWLRSGSTSLKIVERTTFMISLGSILAASQYHPETLRGLVHWTAMFVTKGTNSRRSK